MIVIPSEFYGALYKQLGNFPHWGEWSMDEARETLQKFLDKHLANMVYDNELHIVTKVTGVEYEARCAYTTGHHKSHAKFCKECGNRLDNDLVLKTVEETTRLHREKKWEYSKNRPWWICPDCWERNL